MKSNLYLILLTLIFLVPSFVVAQETYVTKSGGNWNDPTIWQIQVGEDEYIPATTYPTGNDGPIAILSGHNVIINIDIPDLNEVFVTEGSSLTIAENKRVIFNKAEVNDPELSVYQAAEGTVDGKITVMGYLQMNSGARIASDKPSLVVIASTGTYEYNFTSSTGSIPMITWNEGATLLISGVYIPAFGTTTQPSGLDQNFYNVTWKTTSLSRAINLNGTLKNVRGNLEFKSTGETGSVSLSNATGFTCTIGKDFIIGGKSAVNLSQNQTNLSFINIGNDFTLNSSRQINFTRNAVLNISVGNNFVVNSSGTSPIDLVNGAGSTGTAKVVVSQTTQFVNGIVQKSAGATGLAELNLNLVNIPLLANASVINPIVLKISGNWSNSGGNFNSSMTAQNPANYNFIGTSQSIQSANRPFGNVAITTTGSTKTVLDPMWVMGDILLESEATLSLTSPYTLAVSGNWLNASGLFRHNGANVLLNGAQQTITTNLQSFGTLTLGGSGNKILLGDLLDVDGNFIINAGSGIETEINSTIKLGGNWVNNGSFNAGEGLLVFDGNSTQTINGSVATVFNDIEISNVASSPSVRVESNQSIKGVLKLLSGATFDPDGDGSIDFTLLSDATTTATIAPLDVTNGTPVMGSVVVQRYIQPEGQIFRYVSTPVTTANVGNWADDVQINLKGSGTQNLYTYNESEFGFVDNGWTPYPTALTDKLTVGVGYSLGMFDGTNPRKLQIKGPVFQGPIDLPVSFTDSPDGDNAIDDGWNLVGNPYPSAIDWLELWSHNQTANIDPTVWVSDHTVTDDFVYHSYNAAANTGLNQGSPNIANGQAFWVQSIGNAPKLQLIEQHKYLGTDAVFYKTKKPEDVLIVGLKKDNTLDETAIIFRDDAKGGYEPARDTYKLKNYTYSLSSLGENEEDLAYNFQPWFACSSDTRLFLDYTEPGEYSFVFRNLSTFTRNVQFTIIDQLTQKEISIAENTKYTFNITQDPKTSGKERFIIRTSYPSLKTDLMVTAAPVCAGQNGEVLIENAEKGVDYQAFVDGVAVSEVSKGSDNTVRLIISATQSLTSAQKIDIQASRSGCSTAMVSTSVMMGVNPVFEITNVQGATSCSSASLKLIAEGAPTDGSYRWYTSATDTDPIPGATEATFSTPVLAETTTYFVSAVNASGCESATRTKVMATIGAGEKPVISKDGESLSTSGTGTFQWFLNDQPIVGATASTVPATETGAYTVEIKTAEGCILLSEEFAYEVLEIEDFADAGFTVWPNPTSDILYIKYKGKESNIYSLRILSFDGKTVFTKKSVQLLNNDYKIDLRTFKSGLYVIELIDSSTIIRSKIIKK